MASRLSRAWRRRDPYFPWILVAAAAAVGAGLLFAGLVRPGDPTGDPMYLFAAGLLLAVGLYGGAQGIGLREVRRDLRTVVVAVTLGVLLKASLIAGVMVLVFREPELLVLGIAVAQIDPLSVAAMGRRHRMSARARALLSAWASFDDPMTVLLTLYFSILAYHLSGRPGFPGAGPAGDGLSGYVEGVGWNLALFAAVLVCWTLPRWWRWSRHGRPVPRGAGADRLALVLVAVVLLVAAGYMLMAAVALSGLVLRVGRYRRLIDSAVSVAFLTASFALGMLLVDGVDLVRGLVLGATAFGAQALLALLVVPRLMRDLDRADRVQLALGQQNGITAILLALALEPDFPGTVGIVGPAILTVNVLHYGCNGLWARRHREAEGDDAEPGQSGAGRTAPARQASETVAGPRPLGGPGAARGRAPVRSRPAVASRRP